VLTVQYFFDAIGVKYSGDLLIRGIDNKGQIREHPTALEDAFQLGQELVRPDKIGIETDDEGNSS